MEVNGVTAPYSLVEAEASHGALAEARVAGSAIRNGRALAIRDLISTISSVVSIERCGRFQHLTSGLYIVTKLKTLA